MTGRMQEFKSGMCRGGGGDRERLGGGRKLSLLALMREKKVDVNNAACFKDVCVCV